MRPLMLNLIFLNDFIQTFNIDFFDYKKINANHVDFFDSLFNQVLSLKMFESTTKKWEGNA